MIDKRMDRWLILQGVVSLLIFLSTPFTLIHLALWIRIFGAILFILGFMVNIIAFFRLGPSFTPFVKPNEKGRLMTSGIYSIVRHPIYAGVTLLAFGWSLFWGTLLGIILSFVLFLVLDRKANAEEQLLILKYPEYADYKMHVKKLIPFIY